MNGLRLHSQSWISLIKSSRHLTKARIRLHVEGKLLIALSSVVIWVEIFLRSASTSAAVERLDKSRAQLEAMRAARTKN